VTNNTGTTYYLIYVLVPVTVSGPTRFLFLSLFLSHRPPQSHPSAATFNLTITIANVVLTKTTEMTTMKDSQVSKYHNPVQSDYEERKLWFVIPCSNRFSIGHSRPSFWSRWRSKRRGFLDCQLRFLDDILCSIRVLLWADGLLSSGVGGRVNKSEFSTTKPRNQKYQKKIKKISFYCTVSFLVAATFFGRWFSKKVPCPDRGSRILL
jgi:hypothetical protein